MKPPGEYSSVLTTIHAHTVAEGQKLIPPLRDGWLRSKIAIDDFPGHNHSYNVRIEVQDIEVSRFIPSCATPAHVLREGQQ